MESISDISLVAQVAVFHNRRAFDQLVRKYQSPVRRFLLNLTLGNEALSDDLAQDTFLKAYERITQFKGIASFQTWLFRIAYNVFYDNKRKTQTHPHSGWDDLGRSQEAELSAPLPPGKARGWDSLSISTPPLPSSRKTSVRVSPSNSSKAIPSTR